MFKNIARKLILFVITFSLSIIVIPFNNIKAENNGTYKVLSNACEFVVTYNTSNYPNDLGKFCAYNNSNYEVRGVVIHKNDRYFLYFISMDNARIYTNGQVINSYTEPNCNNGSNYNMSYDSYNNTRFYYYSLGQLTINQSMSNVNWYYPVVDIGSNDNNIQSAYRYTYGDLSVDPTIEPVINHGDLKVGYSTEFVSSGTSTDRFNKDIITWDNYDSNGNLLDDLNYTIELRAIPGYYTDVSQSQLLNQTIYNWIQGYVVKITNGAIDLEPFEYYTLGRWSPNKKQVEFTWGEVVDHFDMIDGHVGFILNEQWYKAGWRYEIRYIKGDISDPEYTSDWQTIYQVTAVAPSTSDNILNSYGNGLSPELYNLLQTVNTLNNTVQNWNINGVPINMNQNQQVTPDNSWIEKLIEGITSLLGSLIDGLSAIVQAIIGLGGDIIEGLFSIISDSISAIIEFFTNIWDGFLDLIENINFTDDNEIYDLDIPDYEGLLDVVPAFLRGLSSAGLSYLIWIPLVLGIIFIVL